MSNYNFKNNTFEGSNHFGDSYGSSDEYIKNKKGITGEEKELVKLVFDLFNNQSYKQELLQAIESVKNDSSEAVKPHNINLLKTFKEKLIDEGIDRGVELLSKYLMHAPLIQEVVFNSPATP